MPEPAWHYMRAEDILAEGAQTVAKIKGLAIERQAYAPKILNANKTSFMSERTDVYDHLTTQMDELGIKARGCWEQATAHALLAREYGSNIHQRARELRAAEGEF